VPPAALSRLPLDRSQSDFQPHRRMRLLFQAGPFGLHALARPRRGRRANPPRLPESPANLRFRCDYRHTSLRRPTRLGGRPLDGFESNTKPHRLLTDGSRSPLQLFRDLRARKLRLRERAQTLNIFLRPRQRQLLFLCLCHDYSDAIEGTHHSAKYAPRNRPGSSRDSPLPKSCTTARSPRRPGVNIKDQLATAAHLICRPSPYFMFRSVKNRDVFPAASTDGFTAVLNMKYGDSLRAGDAAHGSRPCRFAARYGSNEDHADCACCIQRDSADTQAGA